MWPSHPGKEGEPWAEPQENGSLKFAVQRRSTVLGGSKVPVPGGVQEEGGDVVAAGILQKISKLQFWVGEKSGMALGVPASAGSQGAHGEQGSDGLVSRDRQRGKGTLVCVPGGLEGEELGRQWAAGDGAWGGGCVGREESRIIQLPSLFWGSHDAGAREGREQLCWTEALETAQFLFRTSRMCCVMTCWAAQTFGATAGKARTPPAGPFSAPASAAHSWPEQEQGQGHRPDRGLRGGAAFSRTWWLLGSGDRAPGFAFASLLPKSSPSWQQVPRL